MATAGYAVAAVEAEPGGQLASGPLLEALLGRPAGRAPQLLHCRAGPGAAAAGTSSFIAFSSLR